MSVQALAWVLEHSRSEGNDRLVLISIANHASAVGHESFPGASTIAREARCSERTVYRSLAALVSLGELAYIRSGAPLGGPKQVVGNRRPNLYWLPRIDGCPGHEPEPGQELIAKGCQLVTPPVVVDDSQPCHVDTPEDGPGVTSCPSRGDKSGAPGVTLVAVKPSVEPSFNHPQGADPIPSADRTEDEERITRTIWLVADHLANTQPGVESVSRYRNRCIANAATNGTREHIAALADAHRPRGPEWLRDEFLQRGHPTDWCAQCGRAGHIAEYGCWYEHQDREEAAWAK
jgi:hypothetical protein